MRSRWDEVESKLALITAWARDGLIDEQIAKNLGIGMSTLSKYKVEHIELVEALKVGKEVIDYEVENMLLKRAMGYEYSEDKEVTDPQGGITYTTTTKTVIPDTTAQIFWLKNRKPKEWRDKQELEHSGDLNHDIQINFNIPRPKSD